MLLSIRDDTLSPDEVSSTVHFLQIQTQFGVILTTMLVYDSSTSSDRILCILPFLMFWQSVRSIKRYVNERLQCNYVVTVCNWQLKYFWVGISVAIAIKIY